MWCGLAPNLFNTRQKRHDFLVTNIRAGPGVASA